MHHSLAKNKYTLAFFVMVIIAIVSFWTISQSEWHLNRNKNNKIPDGQLTLIEDKKYKDENGQIWELQLAIKNKFHQPDHEIEVPDVPYPNVIGAPIFDSQNPNLKFLSKSYNGGSYEAILQPNGEYLTSGEKKGTYNYGHPSGFIGSTKHVILDVIPHFFNSNYKGDEMEQTMRQK